MQHGLLNAYLVFEVPATEAGQPVPGPYVPIPFTCLGHVGTATIDWTAESPMDYQLIPYDDLIDIPPNVRPPYDNPPIHIVDSNAVVIFQLDVTDQIRRWAINPDANDGFVFAGQNESGSPDNGACISKLNNFQLRLVPLR